MSYRTETAVDVAAELRDLRDRVNRMERLSFLSGRVSVGSLRIGDFVLEQQGDDLVASSLVAPFTTTTVLNGP